MEKGFKENTISLMFFSLFLGKSTYDVCSVENTRTSHTVVQHFIVCFHIRWNPFDAGIMAIADEFHLRLLFHVKKHKSKTTITKTPYIHVRVCVGIRLVMNHISFKDALTSVAFKVHF